MINKIDTPKVSITSKFWNRYRTMTVGNALPYQWRALNDEVPVDVPEGAAWGENGSQFSHSLRNLRWRVQRPAVPGHGCVQVA